MEDFGKLGMEDMASGDTSDIFEKMSGITEVSESAASQEEIDEAALQEPPKPATPERMRASVRKITVKDGEEEDTEIKSTGEESTEEETPGSVASGESEGAGDNPDESGQSSPQTALHLLASALTEKGMLPALDLKDVKDAAALLDKMQEAYESKLEEKRYEGLTERQRKYLEGLKEGIPQETFHERESTIAALEGLSKEQIEENQNLRANLIYNDFLERGYTKERAEKFTRRLMETGEDVEEAIAARDARIAKEKKLWEEEVAKAKEAKAAKEQEIDKYHEELKGFIFDEKNEIMEGADLTKNLRERLYETMTKVVDKDEQGRGLNKLAALRKENPKHVDAALNLVMLLTDDFKNLKAFTGKAKSKAIDELNKKLQGNSYDFSRGSGGFGLDSESNDVKIASELLGKI